MADLESKILPGVLHWQSPSFFAWYPSSGSFPALLGDMLSGALNTIGFSWASAPAATELEMVAMDWLADLCRLPAKFKFARAPPSSAGAAAGGAGSAAAAAADMTADAAAAATGGGGGCIQGTSSEAVLVALLAARARKMRGRPPEDAARLVAYGSDQTHSCFRKAAMVAGVHHVRALPVTASTDWALRGDALEAAVRADEAAGLLPFFVVPTIGTTSSCAVDDVEAVARVASDHGMWTHVDAAYAGSAAICPEHRAEAFAGVERADSFSFNPHKWLLTTFDCCAFWTADAGALKDALSLTPVYLRSRANELDYKDWQVPLGRRFRALKLWMVLRMYGAARLRAFVRHHVALAAWFADRVRADARLELAAPPRFGLVCFRLAGAGAARDASSRRLLEAINATGAAFLVATELDGRPALRMAIGGAMTQPRHVAAAWDAVSACAGAVLAEEAAAAAAEASGGGRRQQQQQQQAAVGSGSSSGGGGGGGAL